MTDVTTQKITQFFTSYPLHTFRKRQIIIRAEEKPDSVFYIAEGRVNQYDITSNGNEVVVNVFKTGAFFPMSSAINNGANLYFFEANTEVKAHQIPAADAVKFLKDNPDVTFDLLARVYRGIDGVLRRMAHLMGGDARSRLTFELLNAAQRFGEPQSDGSVLIPLKEGDIAKHSGLARETVNRTMQNLKSVGLVEITPNSIVIPDTKNLEATLGNKI